MAKNWAELPRELLGQILNRLCFTSINSFKDVCKPWYSAVREEVDLSLLRPVPSPPWLTIPQLSSAAETNKINASSNLASFYNLTNKKVYCSSKKKRWPSSPKEAVCVGSCHGWLAFVDFHCVIYLMNPFKPGDDDESSIIQLPPIETLPCILGVQESSSSSSSGIMDVIYWHSHQQKTYIWPSNVMYNLFITQLVMSSPPSSSECTVMIIYGQNRELAFCKPGDKSWTTLDRNINSHDALYYSTSSQQFHVFCQSNSLIEVLDLRDFTSPKRRCIKFPRVPPSMSTDEQRLRDMCCTKKYLAELHGNLLLVVRYDAVKVDVDGQIIPDDDNQEDEYLEDDPLYNEFPYKTFRFDVYKLDWVKKQWAQLKCLGDDGDCVLFLGINNAMSFSAFDFPGLQGNSIYFTDDNINYFNHVVDDRCTSGGHDLGIFNLEDNSIHPCYFPVDFKKISPPPVWISPNPW